MSESQEQIDREHREIQEIIEVEEELGCNDWERNFLRSVSDWTLTRPLTLKQARVVRRLYAAACGLDEHRGKERQEPKGGRKLSPEELWSRAVTPREGDEEILL